MLPDSVFIMWTDVSLSTAFSFFWLLLVTLGFILLPKPEGDETRRGRLAVVSLPVVLAVAAVARLVPAFLLPVGAGYDIESFKLVTDALLSGQEVYTSVLGRHPYLPFQMYIMGAMAYLSDWTGLPYVVAIKLPAILADVALTGLIFSAVRHRKGRQFAAYSALLYALNPISLLVTAYHGQFEGVTLLLLVLAWLAWDTGRERSSAVALGFAILNKTWPVVFLPVAFIRLREWRGRALYSLVALGIPLAFVVLYLVYFSADPMPMLRRALTHRGVAGYWGPGAILNPAAQLLPGLQGIVDTLLALRTWLLLAAVLLTLWITRRQSALDAFLSLLLSMFVVTVGFGIQWLVWPVPFAVLAGEDRYLKIYSLAGAFMLAVHLFGLHMSPVLSQSLPASTADWIIRLSGLPAWLVTVAWLSGRLWSVRTGENSLSRLQERPAS